MPEPENLGAREFFRHPLSAAVLEVVGEKGLAEASVDEFCARADVDQSEFDLLFADKEEAVLRTFEAFIEDFEIHVAAAYAGAERWPDNLRRAAYALVDWIEAHPMTPRFGMVEVSGAPEMARVRRESLLRWCAGLIDAGRAVAPDPDAVPEAASLIAIGAVAEVATREASAPGRLVELVPQLMYVAVRPYLGEEAARAELGMPRPDLRKPRR